MAERAIPQHKRIAMGEQYKKGGLVVPKGSNPLTKVRAATPPVQKAGGGKAHEMRESAAHERREEGCK